MYSAHVQSYASYSLANAGIRNAPAGGTARTRAGRPAALCRKTNQNTLFAPRRIPSRKMLCAGMFVIQVLPFFCRVRNCHRLTGTLLSKMESGNRLTWLRCMPALRDIVYENVREGDLYEKLDRNRVRCFACGHCCPIPEGQPGVCKVRYNQGGTLYVPWGYVGGVQCDPIEKKPFFHAYPGALAYSFGMLGCDLHCGYCQNWVTSQALRDPTAVSPPLSATPETLVADALRQGARVLVSTYNEPLITSEWAVSVFREAKAAGLTTGYVSNGNATPQVLEYLRPWVDLYKVDLKSFDDRHYRQLGGRIAPILDTIRRLHEMGFWVEIVTLLIPGFNDSPDELERLTGFLAGVSPDIPWHVTAFHADYKMQGDDQR